MEQQAVIPFLILKRLRGSAIAAKVESVYETEAITVSTVKKRRKRFVEGRTSLYDDPSGRRNVTNDLSEAISSVVKESPCLSCKVLCQHFRIAKRTCLRILHDTLGMKKSHLRRVPHALYTNRKAERVTLLYGILLALQNIRFTGFQSVTTGDELCCHEVKCQKELVIQMAQKMSTVTSLACQWNSQPC
jgi:hypothetical protein